ncbi:alpha-hydroxy-acid oxidizing protein [Ideonella sp. 4Y16]|uniref:Alpha-hydroxy-acid oxidizing protein n=1 Tax=Ideonella alba TaxID=2824118 RepID=A0A941BE01_9BURK|nr:alpha-hydroxy acid oxidase [Ideonella alba]MBQ0929447.1 alpha-hydroxy-acid oxidizing protein [Ideonella alba]MBQ0944549.1 alpha-hydroxy-acid oxidizing protein [Ideonella alba]
MGQHLSPAPAMSADEFARRAAARLPSACRDYIDGGAADELTLAANRADWAALRLWPRVLRPLGTADTRTRIGPHAVAHPIWLAPVAFQRLAHPDGELASALAAAAQGAGMVLSGQSSVEVERVAAAFAREPGAGPLWFQLHAQPDPGLTRALAQRAQAAGCQAIVLTVDAPVHGVRDRERRAGFRLPAGVRAVHLPEGPVAQHPIDALLQAALTWEQLDTLRAATGLPLWLKGVLHPDDARRALDAGIAGLIVSNHGGRTLDTAVSTAWALPHIARAVDGRLPLLVDGGIRRGTDVLKALALGAQGVLIGRPQVHALAAEGPLGVARLLRILRDELQVAMALTGCARIADITPALLAQ